MARTGRRPGDSGTRDAILAAARAAFGERGYGGASVRGIARDAGVDPALVHHYFGTKPGLFAAAMALPGDPSLIIAAALADGPREEMGERLARTFLGVWDHADRTPVLALLRSAVSHEDAATMFRQFVEEAVVGTVAAAIGGGEDARLRATLAASQLVGVALARYVVGIEPIASAPSEQLVARLAPVLQLHLEGGPA
jgi:AcrR family transcriptional regulator